MSSQEQTKYFVPESKNEEFNPINESYTLLNQKINPKGIIILADFDPCLLVNGEVTLNIPENDNLKLAVIYIDYSGNNNHVGALITPSKIQNLDKNQDYFLLN